MKGSEHDGWAVREPGTLGIPGVTALRRVPFRHRHSDRTVRCVRDAGRRTRPSGLPPRVGFISFAELSWRRFEAATDVVQVGQRVSCEFLQFDTWNLEARLSLKATQPDPFQVFADTIAVGGQNLPGQVTKLIPFGVFVQVADGIEGLVHLRELAWTPVETPADVVRMGDEITVVVTGIDRDRRRLSLSRRQSSSAGV